MFTTGDRTLDVVQQVRKKKLFFYLIFVIIFWGSWLASPVVSSDSFHAVLKNKPNIVLEVEESKLLFSEYSEKNKRKKKGLIKDSSVEPYVQYNGLPLILSARHSGYSFWPFILLKKITNNSFVLWHFITILTFLFLLLRWIEVSDQKIGNELYLLLLSPIVIFQFPFFISELLLPIIFLMILNLGMLEKGKEYFLYGLLIGIGGLVRPNFIWFIPALLILNPINFRDIKKITIILMGAILGVFPYLIMIDWSLLFSEAATYQQNLSWKSLGIETFSLLTLDKTSVEMIYNENYIANFLSKNFFYNFSPVSYFLAIMLIYSTYKMRIIRKWILLVLSYIALMILTIKSELSYSNYLHGVTFFILIIWYKILENLFSENRRLYIATIVLLAINIIHGHARLLSNSPVSWHNKNLTEKVINEIKDDPIVYTLGVTDVGKYEHLSNDELYPIHLYRMVEQNKVNSYYDVIRLTKKGTLIFPEKDEWSLWPKKFGEFKVNDFIERAKRDRIEVDIRSVLSDDKKFFIVRFSEK